MADIFQYEPINIDLKQNYGIGYDLECHQNDLIVLNFIIRNYGEIVDLTNYSVELRVKRRDGSDYIQGGTTGITKGVNGNLKIVCKDSLTNIGGVAKGELRIWDSARNQTTTRILKIDIKNSALDVNRSLSQSTITVMEDLNNILNDAYDVQNDFADKIDKASKSKTELETIINTANTTKTNLDTSITTATTTKTNLDKSNITALSTKSALDTSNTNASKTKADLDSINTIALKTTSDLNTSNTNAITNKSALDTTNTNAINTKNTLDTLNTNATKTKTDLTTVNTNATTTKNDLNALNINAQATKANLDASKVSADTSKKNLDTSIANANNFIDEHGNIIEMLIDIEHLLGKVPLDGGTFFEQYDEWKVDSGTF